MSHLREALLSNSDLVLNLKRVEKH
jgi:hypothetical protein